MGNAEYMGSLSSDPRQLIPINMGDMANAACMADGFDNIQKLPDPVPGVPNFRRVPGFKVFCCGQPTIAGFENALTKVCGDTYPKDGPIIWLNLRQEPDVYVNGEPICARPANKIGEYAELGDITRDIAKANEVEFLKQCEIRKNENGGKLKYVDINKKAFEIDFDIIVKTLVGTSINTPVIVSDQVGLSRATTGCVIACLFKEFQISASFEGLIETVPGINTSLLKLDKYVMNPEKDTLFRGEFDVVKELITKLKDGVGAKNNADKIIDLNGTPKPGGTGIKQLRENIAESKLSYEIMDDAAQIFLKTKIMDNIQKYFYLIAFTAYIREAAEGAKNACPEELKAANTLTGGKVTIPGNELKLPKTFVQFMEENKVLRDILDQGKWNLQWEREIPAAALANLNNLASTDFKGNLGKIIHDIYQTARQMFNDMPEGDHKKRAKYRFASKTLMRLLPAALKTEVESLIEKKAITLDLYEILGQCTWGQSMVV